MAFAINFWYKPEESRSNLLGTKGFQWGTFKVGKRKCKIISKKDYLILRSFLGSRGRGKTHFEQPLRIDSDKKHMLVITNDDKALVFYINRKIIKQLPLSEILGNNR